MTGATDPKETSPGDPPGIVGVDRPVRHCWPTPCLEAAMRAGFAHYKGDGEWVLINDKMRDMLAEFGTALQAAERERLLREVTHLHMAQATNNQNHPNAWHDGVDAALEAMRDA
jgi:hypothetical protein